MNPLLAQAVGRLHAMAEDDMLSPQAAADVGALVAHARLAEVERSARYTEANLRASHEQRRRALARAAKLERDLAEAERYARDLERALSRSENGRLWRLVDRVHDAEDDAWTKLEATERERDEALARAAETEAGLARATTEAAQWRETFERCLDDQEALQSRAAALEAERDEAQARAEDAERGWVSARDLVDRLEQEVADWRVTWDTERRHRNTAEQERDEARAALGVMHQVAEVRLFPLPPELPEPQEAQEAEGPGWGGPA